VYNFIYTFEFNVLTSNPILSTTNDGLLDGEFGVSDLQKKHAGKNE